MYLAYESIFSFSFDSILSLCFESRKNKEIDSEYTSNLNQEKIGFPGCYSPFFRSILISRLINFLSNISKKKNEHKRID